jgi:hypothetical protein
MLSRWESMVVLEFALVLFACLRASTAQAQAAAEKPPLLPLAGRLKFRTLTTEIAKTGASELVDGMQLALAALGDENAELERLREGWEKALASARPSRSLRPALANKLEREVAGLVQDLGRRDESARAALAEVILQLDSEQPEANALLGRQRTKDGEWLTESERALQNGERAVAQRLRSARRLGFDFESGASTNPTLAALGGGNFVRASGIELHSPLPHASLERILAQALRAAWLSQELLVGKADLEDLQERRFLLLDSEAHAQPAQQEALANGGLSKADLEVMQRLNLNSYRDRRGWEAARFVPEADASAWILWRLLEQWMEVETQPCLRVGHLNWLCLSVLGTRLPLSAWLETGPAPEERSSAQRSETREAFWRSTRQSLWGCRAWMQRRVREGRDPPWARAMLEQDGLIRDELLLKTTLVSEFLQAEGRLADLVNDTRGAREPVRAFEKALGEPLPRFEERFRRWLDPTRRRGILQALQAEPSAAAPEAVEGALRMLNQARANALKGQGPEIPIVELDPELSRAAELHARYLSRHPDQLERWPAAHEEYADHEGFSVEGALAGSRSLISPTDDPRKAVQAWLDTFYHRLPILNPGLFGVGLGASDTVIVLDTGSLTLAPFRDHVVLWPMPDAVDVPRRAALEIPEPVPSVHSDTLGYPVTVQLFFRKSTDAVALTLELLVTKKGRLEPVAGYFLSPDAPLQPEYAPPNAWGFLAKETLLPRTRYTARARWRDQERVWSFTTGG